MKFVKYRIALHLDASVEVWVDTATAASISESDIKKLAIAKLNKDKVRWDSEIEHEEEIDLMTPSAPGLEVTRNAD